MGGCNCRGRSKPTGMGTKPAPRTQKFILQTKDGKTQSFGSQLEAQAARIRAGGGTITTK